MLTPYAMSLGQEAYYAELAAEDYYLEGGEPPGTWLGNGAAQLGLGGEVQAEDLRSLFRGYDPRSGVSLVQQQKGRSRQPGWDLTFSAPKSVSVLWAALPEGEHRNDVRKAHESAVRDALEYIEQEAAYSRRGSKGNRLEKAQLVIAAFEHGTSRDMDPQLHTHALVLNAGYRSSDSSWGTIRSDPFYGPHRFAAGAAYRMSLARRMQALGYETVARHEGKLHAFELQIVPKELCDHFSKRRQAIENSVSELGLPANGKSFATAALYTRSKKGHIARSALHENCRAEAKAFGFEVHGPEGPPKHQSIETERELARTAVEGTLVCLGQRGRGFSEPELYRGAAELLQADGVSPNALQAEVVEATRNHAVEVKGSRGPIRNYETPSVSLAQERIVDQAHAIRGAEPDGLNFNADEVQLAVNPQALQCVETYPGSDNIGLLKHLSTSWNEQGYRVRAVTRTRASAARFHRATDVTSESIGFTLTRLGPAPVGDRAVHATNQLVRAARKQSTWAQENLKLGKKDIVVVDSAHRIHPAPLGDLLEHAKKSGAKVVLMGEKRGWGAFDRLTDAAPTTTAPGTPLPTWRHLANHDFANGTQQAGLGLFLHQGCLSVHHSGDHARAAMARSWVQRPETLLVGADKAEVDRLNKAVQYERSLGGKAVRQGGKTFRKQERVSFDRSNKGRGFVAGELGTIEKFKTEKTVGPLTRTMVTIRLDGKAKTWAGVPLTRRVTMPASELKHVSLAYAVTPETAREMEAKDAMVHMTPDMRPEQVAAISSKNMELFASYSAIGEDLEEAHRFAREQERAVAPKQSLAQPGQTASEDPQQVPQTQQQNQNQQTPAPPSIQMGH